MSLRDILNPIAEKEIDWRTKITMVQDTHARNVAASRTIFHAHGINTVPTIEDEITKFLNRHNFHTNILPRYGQYHEAMHIASSGTASTIADEAVIGLYEYVFYGGFYQDYCNGVENLNHVRETPNLWAAIEKAKKRFGFVKAHDESGATMPLFAALECAFKNACEQEFLFRISTNGRCANSVDLNDFLALPSAYLGIVEDVNAAEYTTIIMPQNVRNAIIKDLQSALEPKDSFDVSLSHIHQKLDKITPVMAPS